MKKKLVYIIIGIFVVLSSVILAVNFDQLKENILQGQAVFDNLFYAIKDSQGNYYAITKSRKEIICFDSNNRFKYRIKGINKCNKGFNYANDIIIDESNDSLYISSTYYDSSGDFIEKECILRYSLSGRFLDSIYSKDYLEQDGVPAEGKIKDIKLLETGEIAVAYISEDSIKVSKVNPKQLDSIKEDYVTGFKFDYADKVLLDISIDDKYENIYFTTKKGGIYNYSLKTNELKLIYNGAKEKIFVPGEIKTNKNNDIYIKELIESRLIKFDSGETEYREVFDSDIGFKDFVGFSFCTDNIILVNDNEKIIEVTLSENSYASSKTIDKINYGLVNKLFQLSLWLITALIIAVIGYAVVKLYKSVNENDKKTNRQVIMIIIMLFITTYLITKYLYNTMDARAMEYNYENLLSNLELANEVIEGDKINEIKTIEDFMSEPFNDLISGLNKVLTINGEKDYKKYAGIFIMVKGKMCQLTYQDMDSSFFTPLNL